MRSATAREVPQHVFAAAWQDGAYVVDVRERHEYVAGHVPGARLIPLFTLDGRAADLPRHRTVYVICASGVRSMRAVIALAAAGIEAVSVAGGTSAWQSAGRPVVVGAKVA